MDKKVVLVTGSSRGIGRACIIEFAKKGYDVVINYSSSKEKALELKAYVEKEYNIEALCIKCDVSKENEVKDMVDRIINKFGKIDVLVNNAGIAIDCPFEEKTVENFKRTLDVNLIGTFLVSKYVSKCMLDNKYGKIVNMSSTSGLDSFSPFSLDYNASKVAMISLTHDLAIQLQPYVNVNAIAPGWIDTDMNKDLDKEFMKEEAERTCVKYIAKPEEIAYAAVFLASDEARYINSEVLRIDGGRIH